MIESTEYIIAGTYFKPDTGGGVGEEIGQDSEGRRLPYGERFDKDTGWVLRYLSGSGYSKHLRKLAETEEINFDAGLRELREQGLIDEREPDFPRMKPDWQDV